jgi:hypothetical protein
MTLNAQDDPEASYRRGYQQGAHEAFRATRTTTIEKIDDWVNVRLAEWRYRDRVNDRTVRPPTP